MVLLYPIPEQAGITTPKNYYRHFLGRLHRPQDFQFLVDGMTRILNQPLHVNSSYIPGAQASVKFAPETMMLFWEVTQCNKRFRSFVIDTERVYDFVILILFYALEYKGDASKQGVVRMCAFILQTISVEKNSGVNLNKPFEAQDTLPPAIRIAGFRGTYGDFLIQVSLSTCWVPTVALTRVLVHLQPDHHQPGKTHSYLSRPPGRHQQRCRISGRPQRAYMFQDHAAVQLHVVAIVPSGQRHQPRSLAVITGGHQRHRGASVRQ